MTCTHINRLPLVHKGQVLGAPSVGRCPKEPLPGMVQCEEHTPKEAMSFYIKQLHKQMSGAGLQAELETLAKAKCFPCISLRGFKNGKPVWRAHVNGAGNFWDEGRTPLSALKKAIACWKKKGCPKDGYAVSPRGPYDDKR